MNGGLNRPQYVDRSGATWTAPHLEQFCAYTIEKVMFALAATLAEEGVEPEKRVKIKNAMNDKLMKVAEAMIIHALERKFLNEEALRESRLRMKLRTRTVIIGDDQYEEEET